MVHLWKLNIFETLEGCCHTYCFILQTWQNQMAENSQLNTIHCSGCSLNREANTKGLKASNHHTSTSVQLFFRNSSEFFSTSFKFCMKIFNWVASALENMFAVVFNVRKVSHLYSKVWSKYLTKNATFWVKKIGCHEMVDLIEKLPF